MRVISAGLNTEGPIPSSSSLPPSAEVSRDTNTDTSSPSYDPDIPIPSVESEDTLIPSINSEPLLAGSHGGSLGTTAITRPRILTPQTSEEDDVQPTISLQGLRLQTADSTEEFSRQTIYRSSIQILPSATLLQHPFGDDNLLSSMETLKIHDQGYDSQNPLRSCESSSPTPSRRRRSGSAIIRKIHRVEDEEPPKADMPQIQKALTTALSCVSNTASVLSSSSRHLEPDSTTHKLYQEALTLSQFQLPSSRIVGLIGDSGAGKSSLINSLLDKTDLARAGSSGSARTCAITEYVFHEKESFDIHLEFFTAEELKNQIEELLRAYRDFRSTPRDPRNDDEGSIGETLEKKAILATQTFEAMFAEKLTTRPDVLSSLNFQDAVCTMMEWVSDLLSGTESRESHEKLETCSARLEELTTDSRNGTLNGSSRIPWPLIQKLRVYTNCYILSRGLVLADLPGLRDRNSARRAIAERYIRQCHHVFVVAPIDRIVTNQSVRDIFDLVHRANLSNIDIVCTRSEQYRNEEAKFDWPSERGTIEGLLERINQYKEDMATLKEEIKELEESIMTLTQDERQDLQQLQSDFCRAETSKQLKDLELLRLVTKLRNAKVSNDLLERYQDDRLAATLRIFCVSNTTYWDYRNRPVTSAMPYLVTSGIIELRKHCIQIVAQSRLGAVTEFVQDRVPALLSSIQLWVDAGSPSRTTEMKHKTITMVAEVERALEEVLSRHGNSAYAEELKD